MKWSEILERKTYQIEWSYWDKEIQISSFNVPKNNNIVINIHGTFWSMNWWNNKYLNFAQSLQSENVANVILYESSRVNIENNTNESDRYKQKQAKFIWKTFTDELEDAIRVIQNTINRSKELFWIDKNELEITLNWNSLWWILAFYLAKEFPQVKTIVSVWTWLRLEIKDVPILDTFPDIAELKQKLKSFKWKYVSYFWTEDDVFTRQSFVDLINLVWSNDSNKSEIKMIWVDHTFWKIWWEVSDLPYKQVFLWHLWIIKHWLDISWLYDMNSELKLYKSEILSKINWTLDQWRKDREDLFGW